MKKFIKTWILPLLPYGLWKFIGLYNINSLFRYLSNFQFISKNKALKNRHDEDARCFIVCNGPSINEQNLIPLKDEIVFSVSSGHLYENFSKISPRYHCVPQITYQLMTEGDVKAWFKEMDAALGKAEIFLSDTERCLVDEQGLFQNRSVYYLNLGRQFKENEESIVNLQGIVPRGASVSIMCLMIAMYMGFKKIYLLGVEHNSFQTNTYAYAFQPTILKDKDISVDKNSNLRGPLYDTLKSSVILWEQYRALKVIAKKNGVEIFNATKGGALDEFERVDLESLLA